MFSAIKKTLFQNRSEKQTVVKNTFWLTGSEITVRLIRFGLIVWVARILGAEGWGLFSYTLSFVGIIMTFSDLGMTTLITREFSAQKKDWIKTILILKIIFVVLSIIASIVIGFSTQSPEITKLIPLVTIILASDSLRGIMSSFIRAKEKMEQEAIIQIITNISIVGFSVIFLLHTTATYSLALGYALGSIIGLLLATFITEKTIYQEITSDRPLTIIPVVKSAWPIAVLILTAGVIGNIDSVMIGWWLSIADVGYYATAGRIIQFGIIIPSLFVSALFPTLNKIYQEDKERFIQIAQKSFSALLLLALPIVIGGIIIAKPLIVFLFGNEYIPAVPAFQILLLGTLALFPTALYSILAIITDRQIIIAKNTIGAIIVSILLNIILIPKFGIIGAAIGTIITHWVILMANILFINIPIWINKKTIFCGISGTLVLGLIAFIGVKMNVHPIIIIVCTSIFYGGFLVTIKEPVVQSFTEMFINKKTL